MLVLFHSPYPINHHRHCTSICRTHPAIAHATCEIVSAHRSQQVNSSNAKENSQTRRIFLRGAITTGASIFINVNQAQAYSSPYRPGQESQPLPDRLYEHPSGNVVTTESGLQYFDLATGTGAEAIDGTIVWINYTSRLRGLNGIKVSSSFDSQNAPPFMFRVGAVDVVPGVNEAVRGMRVGGKRRAVLPPAISYASPDMKPAVTEFFARRRLLSVLETNRDATIVFEWVLFVPFIAPTRLADLNGCLSDIQFSFI